MSKLSTHVLDLVNGRPAAGMSLSLWRLDGATRVRCLETMTNLDGRTDRPLLEGDELAAGTYEIVFQVASYFLTPKDNVFLEEVPIRFVVQEGHSYHIPLLCTPWAYQTYRGS